MNESIRGLNSVKEEVKIVSPNNKKEMNKIIDQLIETIKKQQQIETKIDSTDLLENLSKIHYNINENIQKEDLRDLLSLDYSQKIVIQIEEIYKNHSFLVEEVNKLKNDFGELSLRVDSLSSGNNNNN
ncbi:hypothetical protein PIROE2DRAFT_61218 [Piromyces sp. E2]|nr:hypothetical protein PIROE2DRAFT_61218 [Piromyces sp. E2]|eukprot:OUM63536.1 hypothetical protein PIROE2DRAFT_61218 [Piromyces sp. E2]